MNEFPESPSEKPASKATKRSAQKKRKKQVAKTTPRNAPPKQRGGTMTALDYVEAMHRFFMDQQNDPNPLRKFITIAGIAEKLGLSPATVSRYLTFMRDRLRLPVEGIRARGGQGYTEKVHAFPLHTLTQGDMFLLMIAKGALGKGSPFAEKFPPLCAKVENALRDEAVDLKALESIVHFHDAGPDARVPVDPELWDFLAGVCMDRREISFEHLKAEPGATPTQRVIKPLSLHEMGRAWYVWCPDEDRPGHFKKFALSRMSRVERTGRVFAQVEFDPVAYMNGIGPFTGGEIEEVRLRIFGKTALHVQEREVHDSQVITAQHPDGSIEIQLAVAWTPDLEDWINQRSATVQVIAPLGLRARVRELLLAGAALNA